MGNIRNFSIEREMWNRQFDLWDLMDELRLEERHNHSAFWMIVWRKYYRKYELFVTEFEINNTANTTRKYCELCTFHNCKYLKNYDLCCACAEEKTQRDVYFCDFCKKQGSTTRKINEGEYKHCNCPYDHEIDETYCPYCLNNHCFYCDLCNCNCGGSDIDPHCSVCKKPLITDDEKSAMYHRKCWYD